MDSIERLRARERELQAQLARLDADDAALRVDRSDATADDEHDPEGSTLSGEWQRVDALRSSTRDELAQVAAALSRVDAGTYGVCERCGRPIPEARLEVRPQATMCVACASLD
ncbi:TraR/DksA family transcriptional regulator [Microbacterium sp. LMI1x-1-1.1]|uniref:TraR/DksA family transcriptional regulator n=1 Tax=Microbacterium sp. LMI1x-1-1.1 TaxID=3135246 RepID=UPI0034172029